MSETETIEERYEYIKENSRTWNLFGRAVLDLLDDLMAERGKMQERIEELEKEAAEWEDIRTRRMGG